MATGNNFGEKLLPPLCVCVCACSPSVSIVTGKLYAKIESFCRAQLKLRFSIANPGKVYQHMLHKIRKWKNLSTVV